MDYEKKYKEALERAKQFSEKPYLEDSAGIVEYIFPELKESEDERIRKNIIATIHLYYGEPLDDEAKEMIAWLEKQGEHKSTLPKWKYKSDNTPLLRDSLILNKYGGVAKSPSGALVSDVWVLDYEELAKLPKEELEEQCEKKPVSITDEWIEDYWQHEKVINPYSYDKGEEIQFDHQSFVRFCKKYCRKPTWSEEDEHRVKDTVYFLDTAKKHYASVIELDACIDWLKQLKQRIGWKPSKGQMKALHDLNLAGNISYAGQGQVLIELYNDLKKLIE